MRATIKDIAEQVGVSKSLVSMYLNNHPLAERIAEATKKKIDEVVRDMDYQPSSMARSLRKGKTRTIGLVIARISSVYSSFYSETLLNELEKYDYQLLISITRFNRENERKCLLDLVNRQADGILYGLYIDPEEAVPSFLKNYPLLLTYHPNPNYNTILSDDREPMQDVCELMKEKGLKKIFSARLFYKTALPANSGIEISHHFWRDYKTNRELLEAVRAEKADVLELGSCQHAASFLNELAGEKDLPYILYPYGLPSDYFEHPKILGAISKPFQEMVSGQVKRIIEMVEEPKKEISHLHIPAKFMNPSELKKLYLEQLADPAYKVIVDERKITSPF